MQKPAFFVAWAGASAEQMLLQDVDDQRCIIRSQFARFGIGKQQATAGHMFGAELVEGCIAFIEAYAHTAGVSLRAEPLQHIPIPIQQALVASAACLYGGLAFGKGIACNGRCCSRMPGAAQWIGASLETLAHAALQLHTHIVQDRREVTQLAVQLLQIVLYAGVLNADGQHLHIPLK